MLCIAANALLRTRRRTTLGMWAQGLLERMGRKKAIVAIARKIAAVAWSMLKHETDFEPRVFCDS